MRAALLTLLSFMLFLSTSQAQQIRLGHRIPDIKIVSEHGEDLKFINKEYVCLVFVHSESHPCMDALAHLRSISNHLNERMATVLISAEDSTKSEAWRDLVDDNIYLTFDNNLHTFHAFGVNFVPFGVVYDTKRRRALWFGSLLQLQHEVLDEIILKQ